MVVTSLPPLLNLPDEGAYRSYFVNTYCNTPIITFDNIIVRFYPEIFDHAFYRDSSPIANDKSVFALERAQKIDWIRTVLADPTAELYRRTMSNSKTRRIAVEPTTPYAVIIQIHSHNSALARFVTAYVVDSMTALKKMRSNPRW